MQQPINDSKINDLIQELSQTLQPTNAAGRDYISDMLTTISKFAHESADIGDMKLINTTLKELRYSFKLFAPFRDTRKVCIFGSARTKETIPEYQMARDFAEKITQKGFLIITGAGSGIMEAGNRGAKFKSSFGVNIQLPFEQNPNPYIIDDEKLMTFKYFFNRKVVFIKESDATVLFPGGYGTHDEAFENLTLIQTGKCAPRPIILLAAEDNSYWQRWLEFVTGELLDKAFICEDDLSLFTITKDVDHAVHQIENFYRIYHSIRYFKDTTILRLNKELPDKFIEALNQEFQDITISGIIEKIKNSQIDSDRLPDKPRIAFHFDRMHYGRLMEMIRWINMFEYY